MYCVRLEKTFLDFVSFSQLWSKIFICEGSVAEQFVLSTIRTRPWRTRRFLAPRLHNIRSLLPSLTFPVNTFPTSLGCIDFKSRPGFVSKSVFDWAICNHGNGIRSLVSRRITECISTALVYIMYLNINVYSMQQTFGSSSLWFCDTQLVIFLKFARINT